MQYRVNIKHPAFSWVIMRLKSLPIIPFKEVLIVPDNQNVRLFLKVDRNTRC